MSDQTTQSGSKKPIFLFISVFLLLTLILLVIRQIAPDLPVDYNVIFVGNLILLVATIFSYLFYKKALGIRVQAFVGMIYGGMLVKMGICVVAFLIYVLAARHNVSKGAIYGCFILYFIYSFAEMKVLLQVSRKRKNA